MARTKILSVALASLVAAGTLHAPLTAGPHPRCSQRVVTSKFGSCGFTRVDELRVSKDGGLGRIELAGDVGAVLQRDEGFVSLLDMKRPGAPRIVGRYEDGAPDSLDGDLVFSADGDWLFYARQTEQFSQDGIHVLNVADPAEPSHASYMPAGGAYRIEYLQSEGVEYVYLLDAIEGLVVYRFERALGQLVPVHVDALPALKVGGPASAGFFLDEKDPATGTPLLYVTTGRTGLQVFDLADPAAPVEVGAWSEVGLAEVEVRATKRKRVVYAATEYWFNGSLVPEVVVLDASKLDAIERSRRLSIGAPADDAARIQGMTLKGGRILVAHSSLGTVSLTKNGRVKGVARYERARNEGAGVASTPYSFDVETSGGYIYITDAATGRLQTVIEGFPQPRDPNGR